MSLSRAIIRISATSKHTLSVNYARRMYAIIRRYTPEALEGASNECFAELTGLRTFFKMTYNELAETILRDLSYEIGIRFTVRVAKVKEYEDASTLSKKLSKKHPTNNVSTYKELNTLFAERSLDLRESAARTRSSISSKKIRLSVPFLGKVR